MSVIVSHIIDNDVNKFVAQDKHITVFRQSCPIIDTFVNIMLYYLYLMSHISFSLVLLCYFSLLVMGEKQ